MERDKLSRDKEEQNKRTNALILFLSQFFIYAAYFAAISLLFTIRGGYTVFHVKKASAGNQAERASHLPEVSRL